MTETNFAAFQSEFETIYETYYDRIYNYAYTLLLNKENAEDITEDTFLAAYRMYASYDPEKASVGTWLTRIAHNRAVNLLRSSAYAKRADMPETWEPQTNKDMAEEIVAADVVLELYTKLKPEEREFLNLRYVMELKDGEIAALLGIKEKAVNKRYQRLLAKCKEMLAER